MNSTTPYSRSIHALVAKIGMSDEDYRTMLRDRFNVTSSVQLSGFQARTLCSDLLSMCPKAPAENRHPKRHEDLGSRGDGFASPKQIRMLEAAFVQRSFMLTLPEKQKSFREFIKNRFQIPSLEWIGADKVGPILKAIKSIKNKQPQTMEAANG